jgi:hypothetical protein
MYCSQDLDVLFFLFCVPFPTINDRGVLIRNITSLEGVDTLTQTL